MPIPKNVLIEMESLKCSYSTRRHNGAIIAEIIDLDTGKPYAKAEGNSEDEAIVTAFGIAKTSPRPLTGVENAALTAANEQLQAANARIAELEEKVRGGKSSQPDRPPDRPGKRPTEATA